MTTIVRPTQLEDVLGLLADRKCSTAPIGGGIGVSLTAQDRRAERYVALRQIRDLRGCREEEGGLAIGAAETIAEVADAPDTTREAPLLGGALGQVGTPSIRNIGTLGGNLATADGGSDAAVALAALGATAVVLWAGGRREVSVADLVARPADRVPGELVARIRIGRRTAGWSYHKLPGRGAHDGAVATAAVAIWADGRTITEIRIVVGAVTDRLVVLTAADRLVGAELSGLLESAGDAGLEAAVEAELDGLTLLDDQRASAWYRRRIVPVLVRRGLADAAARCVT